MATQEKDIATPEAEVEETETETPVKEPRFVALTDEEAAWVEAHARPAASPCLCGCGELTKGRFVPGHDARLKERLRATLGERKDTPAGSAKAQKAAKAALETFGW